jgi:phospholipase C
MTRRQALRVAGGAGLALAASAGGVPAWARAVEKVGALRGPDSLPFPRLAAGTESLPQIDHIVIVMMENHSFDNFLGLLPSQVRGRRSVDGLRVTRHGQVQNFNRDADGNVVRANHAATPCQLDAVPGQDWNRSHISWDDGRNDGFVRASGPVAMWYWDQTDLPFTYSLAAQFPLGERYFQSCLAQTYPNRRFLFAGTASGTIATDNSEIGKFPAANGTIFDRLDHFGISWKDYFENLPSILIMPNVLASASQRSKIVKIDQFFKDAASGSLPQVSILEPNYTTTSEENPQDIQIGEGFVHDVVNAVLESPSWPRTALFLTHDEHGGYYDHVPPPRAIPPDDIQPRLKPGDLPGSYDRYGFRVPMIVVSPWARRRHVSRRVQDHTSILAFIERKWNLGALTFRDANADPMLDYFDFRSPAFLRPPPLAGAPPIEPGLRRCLDAGMHPPLPPGTPLPSGGAASAPASSSTIAKARLRP